MVFMTNVLRTAILPLTEERDIFMDKRCTLPNLVRIGESMYIKDKKRYTYRSLSLHTHKLANHHHQLSKVLRTKTSSRQAELQSVMNIVLHLSISDQMEFDCNLLSWRHARIYSFCFNLRCRATEARGPLASVYY